jgi:FKBP-type peptidyl-prolyl cis-trans isomerase
LKKLIYILLPIAFTVSCNLTGVDPTEDEADSTIQDSIREIRLNDTKLNDHELLLDSIDGKPNEMVYQAKSGLRLEWSSRTENPKIGDESVALVNYSVRVAGGEEYDNNDKVGKPVPLKPGIGMMVEGWDIGLREMSEGDKGRIMIPNALAYGEEGYSTIVPPKADLVVDIEIVKVIKPIVLKEGVKVYKWQTNEEGASPRKDQEITFDYFAYHKGEDAHMYDNSYQNGDPFVFKYKNASVIDGLHQGMSVMKAGENAFIDIPAELAYGKKGLVDHVPSNRDIVYDVRVLSIED